MDFGPVITAIVTPFSKNGQVDLDTFEKILNLQIDSGVDGVVVFGTTGECPTLTKDEKVLLLKKALQVGKEKISIIANTGTNSTQESIELTALAKELGADAALAIVPYYNKPDARGIVEHFHQIANIGLPVIFYHHPKRTGIKLDLETIEKISLHPNIVAIKECSSDFDLIQDMKSLLPNLSIYSGNDDALIDEAGYGLDGVISVVGQIFPMPFIEFFKDGNAFGLKELQPVIQAIFSEVNPQGIKAAWKAIGYDHMELRLPMVSVKPETMSRIAQAMNQFLHCKMIQ